jgi:hypothetical protein
LGQRQPPSIQWRFVFLNGDINLGSSWPQLGQGGGRRENNMMKKTMPAKTENSVVSFISGSYSLCDYIGFSLMRLL